MPPHATPYLHPNLDLAVFQAMSLLLNPSTLDESSNDPAVRRCVNNAALWGYGAMETGNLFALRSTGPRGARQRPLPSGHARAVRQADKEAQAKARARAAGDATETGHHLLAQPLSKTISIFAATPVPAAAEAGRRASKRAL